MRRALLTISAVVWSACGGGGGMPTPSPSSSTAQPGGPVTGAYLAQVTPAAGCAMAGGPFSFPVQAAAAGTSPHAGVQVLLEGDGSRFELEFLSTDLALRGGVGTTEEGVLSNEGQRLWIHAIGSGAVFRAPDARGQMPAGTLSGYIALAAADGDEGDLGTCTAGNHSLVLRTR